MGRAVFLSHVWWTVVLTSSVPAPKQTPGMSSTKPSLTVTIQKCFSNIICGTQQSPITSRKLAQKLWRWAAAALSTSTTITVSAQRRHTFALQNGLLCKLTNVTKTHKKKTTNVRSNQWTTPPQSVNCSGHHPLLPSSIALRLCKSPARRTRFRISVASLSTVVFRNISSAVQGLRRSRQQQHRKKC